MEEDTDRDEGVVTTERSRPSFEEDAFDAGVRRFIARPVVRDVVLPLLAILLASLSVIVTVDEVADAAAGPGVGFGTVAIVLGRLVSFGFLVLAALANTTWGRTWSDTPLRPSRRIR